MVSLLVLAGTNSRTTRDVRQEPKAFVEWSSDGGMKMARHHTNRGEQRSTSKRQDREARAGERADYLKITAGNADYGTPVQRDMARLRGRSESQLMRNDQRGATSPIGMGSH